MKLNLDENAHTNVAPAQHAQGLAGHPDADLARAVRAEKRVLITCDLNFADPRLRPPEQFAGLVVLRLGAPTGRNQIAAFTHFFAATTGFAGRLSIIERARNWTP